MSRIGNSPVIIPEGTSVAIEGTIVSVKGKLGEFYNIGSNKNLNNLL